MALAEPTTAFYWTSNTAAAIEIGIDTSQTFDMALLRRYPGHPPASALFPSQHNSGNDEDGTLVEQLESFFAAQKLPDFINYEEAREDSGRLLLSVPIPWHLYVVGPAHELNNDATIAALRSAAAPLRGNIGILTSDIGNKDENGYNTVADLFQVDQNSTDIFVSGGFRWK